MRAIKRDASYEDLIKLLGERPHPDSRQPVFRTMRDALAFAAAVGFAKKKRLALGKKTSEIPFRIFESKPELIEFMYMLAVSATGDKNILRPTSENDEIIAKTFEEFAAGGLDTIGEWLREQPRDAYGAETIIAKLQSEFFPKEPGAAEITAEDIRFG